VNDESGSRRIRAGDSAATSAAQNGPCVRAYRATRSASGSATGSTNAPGRPRGTAAPRASRNRAAPSAAATRASPAIRTRIAWCSAKSAASNGSASTSARAAISSSRRSKASRRHSRVVPSRRGKSGQRTATWRRSAVRLRRVDGAHVDAEHGGGEAGQCGDAPRLPKGTDTDSRFRPRSSRSMNRQ
jgi:hypothetical protein